MVKEVKGYKLGEDPARSIKEFNLLPGRTLTGCIPENVNLSQTFNGIHFKFPIIPASMSCLYYDDRRELAVTSSKEGMPPVIHYNQPINAQAAIIRTVKKAKPSDNIELLDDPLCVNPDDTLDSVLANIEKHGHSIVPIVNRFRVFEGVFVKPFYDIDQDLSMKVKNLKAPLYFKKEELVVGKDSMTGREIKELSNNLKILEGGRKQTFLPLLDGQQRLIKIAFIEKFPNYFCGAAISTREGWEKRAEACIEAGADFIFTDTSDAYSEFIINAAKEFKKKYPKIPLGLGNIITAEAFEFLKEYADFIKVGMMTGAACKTGSVKSIGRPLFTALYEIDCARNKYAKQEGGKYIPLVADGGIALPGDMIIALSIADLIMAGRYFAQFHESAGEALDKDKKRTDREDLIIYKEYWGEGSNRAKNLARYGYNTRKTSVEEGVDGWVPYKGRLKPNVELDFKAVSSALSNAGCLNLEEFRKNSILELLSEIGMREKYPEIEYKK